MKKSHFLIGTRWFGVLGPTQLMIDKLNESGYKVFVFGQKDERYGRYYHDQCELVEINMKRSYVTPFHDIADIIKIIRYLIKYKPDGVHSFNPKPALLSFFSVLFFPSIKFFIGVTGLGNTFIRAKGFEPFVRFWLRLACKKASFVFFQNHDDVKLFKDKKLVSPDKIKMFIGPGVDLRLFEPHDRSKKSNESLNVLCVARLLWQKGVGEFCESAAILKKKYPNRDLTFTLIGDIDPDHPDKVPPSYIEEMQKSGAIEYISWTDKIHEFYRDSDINFLHSYREGAPRAILEGSALSLPTVGSIAPGVKELVIDGETGYLIPLKDIDGCVAAIEKLLDDKELRLKLGENARAKIAEPYSLKNSSKAQMTMYTEKGYKLAAWD